MSLLEINHLDVFHGQLQAITALDLTVAEGETVAVIGANGAGKSTLLRTIMGLLRANPGSVHFDGADITTLPAFRRTRTGIAMVPEGRRLFRSLSLEENLLTGAYRGRSGPWTPTTVANLFEWMPARRREAVSHLSGGQQQAVAIGRALISNPRLLLIDELSLGLAPVVAKQVYGILPRIVSEGTSILLVDQDVSQSLAVADRVCCLLEGRKVLEGTPAELTMRQIEAAYFGVAHSPDGRFVMDVVNIVLQGLLIGGLYALTATGLSLMFGVMRIVNLAHGDMGVAAAFLAFVFISQAMLPVWVAVLIAIPVFAGIGYLVQRVLLNRSIRVGPLATLLVTFGLSVVIQNVLLQTFSADTRTLDVGALATASWRINDQISLSYLSLITFALAIVVIVAVQLFLSRSGLGRMMRAASDDPEISTMVGGDSRHLYGVATAIAFATVAIGGLLLAMRSSFDPSLGPGRLLFAFEAVVIGGLGSLWGTLAGGVVLGLSQTVVGFFDPTSSILAGHLVFLIVLAFRPQGLIPRRVS